MGFLASGGRLQKPCRREKTGSVEAGPRVGKRKQPRKGAAWSLGRWACAEERQMMLGLSCEKGEMDQAIHAVGSLVP